jgi:Conserved oligomeric complex COG6
MSVIAFKSFLFKLRLVFYLLHLCPLFLTSFLPHYLPPLPQAATWVDVLASEEVSRTLRRSDLDKLLEILEVIPVGIVASQQQGLGQDRVATVMRAFYASLFSTMTPHFERLQDLELRETTRKSTAEAIAAAHEKVRGSMMFFFIFYFSFFIFYFLFILFYISHFYCICQELCIYLSVNAIISDTALTSFKPPSSTFSPLIPLFQIRFTI